MTATDVLPARAWLESFAGTAAGPDKVVPLAQAVQSAVRPGMTLHFAYTHNRPTAAIAELVRRFRGTEARFDVVMLFTAGPALALLSEGLTRRLITALVCDPYPSPAPSRAAQRAIAQHGIAIEHWSVLSLCARLEAAARSLPWLPVASLRGSHLCQENRAAIEGDGDDDGPVRVRALTPDLSFVHAPAADRFGNVLLTPPYGEGAWGALAAREGVVVTVDRLLTPDELRRHAHLVGIPAAHVRSVSVVPFGAHPAGLASGGIDEVEPYGDDARFYQEARRAAATDDGWRRFVERWLLEPTDHDGYLARLGADRLLALKGKARPDSWRAELLGALASLDLGAPPTRTEAMIVASARLLASKVRARGHRAILSGLGAGNLAAWLAHPLLAAEGTGVELIAELGMVGYTPRPCDPYLFNFRNLATCTLRTDAATALGVLLGNGRTRGLGSLGAAQVDGAGNFNSTRLDDGTLLVGSGGANDVASVADAVVVTLPAARDRLVERLAYVTGPGDRVTAVVTDLGVLEKELGRAQLRLTTLLGPLVGGSVESHVRELAGRAGFRLEVAPALAVEPPPARDQLERLRLFDPERAFLGPLEGPTRAP